MYNGNNEWQNEFSNLLDYNQTFFRNYDPATGRFIASDPMPDSAESMTTYQYARNNPVILNDPLGNFTNLLQIKAAIAAAFEEPFGASIDIDGDIQPYGSDQDAEGQNSFGMIYTVSSNPGIIYNTGDASATHQDVLESDNGNSLNVDQGILDTYKRITNAPIGYDYLMVNNNDIANSIFLFLSGNTDVEWSLVRFDINGNYITTSHQLSEENSGYYAIQLIWSHGGIVNTDIHDHPTNLLDIVNDLFGPSGFNPRDLNTAEHTGDKQFAQQITLQSKNFQSAYPPINFEVYDVYNNYYYQYNGSSILNNIPLINSY